MAITNAQLAQQITDLVNKWNIRESEMIDWLAGVVDGGPNSDGKYPITDLLSNTTNVTAPVQFEADIAALIASAQGYDSAASASAAAASTSETNAATSGTNAATSATNSAASAATADSHKDTALTAAQDAQAARDLADNYANNPEDAEVSAGKYSANHYSLKAAVSASNLAAAQAKAEQWADEDEDTEVETGQYSAKHHSAKAAAEVVNAQAQVSLATTQANNAAASATAAAASEAAFTPAGLLADIKTVDGAGSGLDADTLDGMESNRFVRGGNSTRTTLISNINAYNESGFYAGANVTGAPDTSQHYYMIGHHESSSLNTAAQVAFNHFEDKMYFRRLIAGTPGSWNKIYHEGDDTGWIYPTLLNGWVAYNTAYNTPSYRKGADGFVYLRGLMKSGTLGLTALILPAGYRPSNANIFATINSLGAGRVDITTSGAVVPHPTFGAGNTYLSLDGLSFKAE